MEVTSPSTRHLDVASRRPDYTKTRFLHYAWAKIPLYIIVDEARRGSRQAPRILGYELTEEGYQPLPLDGRGWLWVEPVGLWLGPVGERVAWFDEDGQEIWEYEQEQEARQAAEERAQAEQEARQAAEEARWIEREARRMAEAQARAEQEARQVAEERAQAEQEARRAEQEARQAAEERVRELERLLQQRQGSEQNGAKHA
ncbi:MAG: hypothetical protein HC884_19695 [Chloroflexaceae bacterium]|nr:hypothetical protein [Chloroflexaceae bacterium]